MKTIFTYQTVGKKARGLLFFFALLLSSSASIAQLGVYSFTGTGACPNQNPAVNSQPTGAVFSNYSTVGSSLNCNAITDAYQYRHWNSGTGVNLNEYNQFTITPGAAYTLTLTSLTFTQVADEAQASTAWVLRSSLDNYTTDLGTGSVTTSPQTPTVNLPAGSFTNIGAVTFRLYFKNALTGNTYWTNDEVTLNGTANQNVPADPGNPTSNSPQCSNPGVTITAAGTPAAGISWYWETSATGTSTANNASSSQTVTTPGTYYIRAQDNATLVWSAGAGSIAVTITPNVGTPVFTTGATSTRCQGGNNVTYTANASNSTGIIYDLDAVSLSNGNTINSATGVVTYSAAWNGISVITATASGCGSSTTATHTVTITSTVGATSFTLGATSNRCQGTGSVTYTASATNNTGIVYTLDAPSTAFGNSIVATTGKVNYLAGWTGTSTITATSSGCNGPTTATHTVTTIPTVGTPVFSAGPSSTRCQGAGTVNYSATATTTTGITYTLDNASTTGGNSINAATGDVTYVATWSGTSTITASAAGCNGPKTSTHTVTITPTVGTPIFSLGATSSRCLAANTVTYTATATNSTGITYSLDATSTAFGNSINAATGAVTYLATWVGTSTVTATASGCNGPSTASHTITTNPAVLNPVFTLGATSVRCQGGGTITYTATAVNSTGITYSIDALSDVLNNINAATGQVTWSALWNGTSIITATAAGCNGPKTTTHTVTVTATVGTPVFDLGSSSTRCQGANTVNYNATATTNTGITYTLDATSLAAGNTIDPNTGDVIYTAAWTGTATITATATGCSGPKSSSHTATTNTTVGATTFTLGASSTRCQGNTSVTYTATASSTTGITYTLDAASTAAGNSINAGTGKITYNNSWVGTSIITATAAGCNGPTSNTHSATTIATVGTPVFTLGASSVRCQGAGTQNYAANATTTTGITYALDNASATAGNTINPTTGDVTYLATWSGTTTITASAAGCSGPKTATHVVTVTPTVGTPVFTLGATSTRCLGGGTVTYTATATNNTGITYTLDATSTAFGNSINAATGAVTYLATWVGNSTITATATGCNGPSTASHVATSTPAVINPVFASGSTSTRCQGAGTVSYTASATNTTGITYTLDAASLAAGNTIVAATGAVTYTAAWTGTSTITANAAGCAGPKTSTHVVTITPTVGTPIFALGATSTRCQGAATVTYSATSTNNTGITYTLDPTSIAGGNSINAATGDVTYVAGWTGSSTITATATGCNGPKTANHTVTINITVGPTTFTLGATSTRCQGAGSVTYTANATNKTGISYTLDATATAAGNNINAATGVVTYVATWSGNATITATSTGCNGPTSATHVATTTATVGTPTFTLGANSTRCQGAATVTYTATATTTTGITYTLDATSTAAGNSINAATGAVTYTAAWSGSSTITASAAGCSGPKTATHIVTTTATVGTPVFALGSASVRTQGAGIVTYTATATTTTGITYSLNAAALAAGNTINASTGAVTYTAAWSGTTSITATAAGCNGPAVSTHIVSINTTVATSQLYLSDPGQILDRIDPVATGLNNTVQSVQLSNGGTISFTQSPVMCSDLIIKAQTITISLYITPSGGTMPANPAITALLKYGATNTTIVSLSNPTYNSSTNLLTWTGVPASDITVSAGNAITLVVTDAQGGVSFKIDYHSQTKPSKISLPVSTFIDITSFNIYNAVYPGGNVRISSTGNTVVYARAVVIDPFGSADINGTTINITPPGTLVTATAVATAGCTKTYEYAWTTPAVSGNYTLTATAKQGYENTVTRATNFTINICAICPPVAMDDSTTGSGGAPLIADVLANDYDPNNNLNPASLAIITQANNGTAFLSNGKIIYLPNGSYAGRDTITYQVCDNTSPTPLCATAQVFFTINPSLIDPCGDATKSHTYFLPFSETEARMALDSSTTTALASNNIRTVISLKVPYPGMIIVWDHWEDGYEANPLNPTQSTTLVWGDGNPYNGIAPGYANDIIPAGGGIVLDNTIPTNPRVATNFFFDGKDKIYSSGQVAVTQVCGEPSNIGLQCMKTNVSSTAEYGTNFTIPVGQNFNSQDFRYTALFIRAQEDNTTINIDKDNNGTFETTATINQGEVYLVNGGVMSGASISASAPVGVDLHFGGVDNFSSREVPIFPASWYYNTYYSPVPTTGRNTNPADSAVVMLYNNLNRAININWSSGVPSNGTIALPAKSVVRFPLAKSQTAAYKFVNPTGESFTAIEIADSYTPGGGGNGGSEFDWAFNLIAENRLTDYATIAWAPGSTDGSRDDNPIWVTPTANTTIYVKYDGNVTTGALVSPCGLHYDVSYPLNVLNHKRLLDLTDNDQSGLAVYTCDGVKLAAVYGEDPSTAVTANPSWDVGSTIQPFCKEKLIFANDDYGRTMVNQPVTIPILLNDYGFLAVVDPTSVTTTGLLQPKHGTVTINPNGTVLYTPNAGYIGNDTFEYSVCSTPSPIVCDVATVYIQISVCPSPLNENIISGQLYLDKNKDGINNDGGQGFGGSKVYLYVDGNCNATIDANELKDSIIVDASGTYQFTTYPEKFVADDFDGPGGTSSCASGSDGSAGWASNWVDAGDPSTGFCNNSQSAANTDAEIVKDGAFGYALRLKDNNVSATRTVNLSSASYAFLTFSYRRKSASLTSGRNVIVQASSDGSTFGTVFTIAGDGNTDANYVTIYNQDITAYASATTYIRFLTNNSVADADTVYIDNVKIQFLKYPQCYITKVAPSTVPSTYHFTTPTQNSFTATSGITCLAPFDFGIAKNDIGISGTLFNDANGLTDVAINGTPINAASGTTMYAYLIDTSGKIAFKSNIAANGAFNFPNADVLATYDLKLSTNNMSVFNIAPSSAALPSGWVATGDSYGTNNMAGSGICAWTPFCYSNVNTGVAASITNVNFGIERLPDSDPRNVNYQINVPGVQYDITGGLTGLDAEDGVLGNGKTYMITSLPTNAILIYNGVTVTLNQVITNFNASLLKIDPDDSTSISYFTYASRDAAGLFDPTPALVTVTWGSVLPISILDFSGKLNGTKVDLFWSTSSESNSDRFDVERSTDGINFSPIGTVKAKGTSSVTSHYVSADPLPVKGMNYYRLKMIDKDGAYIYSKTIAIQVNKAEDMTVKIMPNPFTSKLDIYINLPRNSDVTIDFVDMNGIAVLTKKVKGYKGYNWFSFSDLDKVPSAAYMLKLSTDDGIVTQKLIKARN